MELKEAKNILEERKFLLINSSMPDISLITAIDTVLEELNNRIPKKEIEDKIEKVRCETTWNYNDWKYDEKVYNAEHNMINIIEKELLNKEVENE